MANKDRAHICQVKICKTFDGFYKWQYCFLNKIAFQWIQTTREQYI